MQLDFSQPWRIVYPEGSPAPPPGSPLPDPAGLADAASFAAAELAAILGRMSAASNLVGDGTEGRNFLVLDLGDCAPSRALEGAPPCFGWRASKDRVEIHGEDGSGLIRGVYDFLSALGASWPYPGSEGERLPTGPILELERSSGHSGDQSPGATLILGHASYLEAYGDYLPWAARNGYSSVFFHVGRDSPSLGSAPLALYESLRGKLSPLAARLGLSMELGGHLLSSFLPRSRFGRESGLFRMHNGRRKPDSNFCPSSGPALEAISSAFAAFASSHSEVSVFHVWPDDLPGGGWCSCPDCAGLGPAQQSLLAARALAAAAAPLPGHPRLSFLAYHDSAEFQDANLGRLPGNLELVWAPRMRSWAGGLAEPGIALNAASLGAFRTAAKAWTRAGGARVTVFEYWEDAFLFKGAVPPLSATMAGDVAAYTDHSPGAGSRADAVGILCAGSRLPFAARPNPWLLGRLIARQGRPSAALMAEWSALSYGPAAEAMDRYWVALEAAWKIDLDLEPGDTGLFLPEARSAVDRPPADWGDPWKALPERLEQRRGSCEELFDFLREAEAALAEAGGLCAGAPLSPTSEAVLGEEREYLVADALLELDCARLSAYHEAAFGAVRAAGDLAYLAESTMSSLFTALRQCPDRRSRRESTFLIFLFYGLRLRLLKREAGRNPLKRAAARAATMAELALRAAGIAGTWQAHKKPGSGSGRRSGYGHEAGRSR